jgi:tetratricopeptide (TPR) repeat protein
MSLNLIKLKEYFVLLNKSINWYLNKPTTTFLLFPFKNNKVPLIILACLSGLIYFNTLGHQTAFDDEIVIKKNDFVLKGVKGIPDILSKESFYSYYENTGQLNVLPGGRYRPLSLILFAIEQEIVGTRHDSVPYVMMWDVNGNGIVDPDEDTIPDKVLSNDDFYARGLGLRHFNNVLTYILLVCLLYVFLTSYASKINEDVVFFACLLFTAHPLHTEVVANIKSRDELFSLLFIFLGFLFAFRYLNKSNKIDIIFFSISFFLALLSKEYAILAIPLIPITYYLFQDFSIKSCINLHFIIATFSSIILIILVTIFYEHNYWIVFLFIAFVIVGFYALKLKNLPAIIWLIGITFSVYLLLRFNALSENSVVNHQIFKSNIISNPYLLASSKEIIATKLYVLLKYILLLIIPNPLICDYSFNTISYRNFSSIEVYVALIIFALLIVFCTYNLFKRKPIAFPCLFLIIFVLPICNFFIDIGAIMGERLIFHSSVGFCLLVSWPLSYYNKLKNNSFYLNPIKYGTLIITTFIIVLFSIITIQRNKDWENNITLFDADYPKAPNNISLINSKANNCLLKAEKTVNEKEREILLRESINFVDKGLQVNGAYTQLYQTLTQDFYLLKEFNNAIASARAGMKLDSSNYIFNSVIELVSKEYLNIGLVKYKLGQKDSSLLYFEKSIKALSNNKDAYYNKAFVLKEKGDTSASLNYINKAIMLDSKNKKFNKFKSDLIR